MTCRPVQLAKDYGASHPRFGAVAVCLECALARSDHERYETVARHIRHRVPPVDRKLNCLCESRPCVGKTRVARYRLLVQLYSARDSRSTATVGLDSSFLVEVIRNRVA